MIPFAVMLALDRTGSDGLSNSREISRAVAMHFTLFRTLSYVARDWPIYYGHGSFF